MNRSSCHSRSTPINTHQLHLVQQLDHVGVAHPRQRGRFPRPRRGRRVGAAPPAFDEHALDGDGRVGGRVGGGIDLDVFLESAGGGVSRTCWGPQSQVGEKHASAPCGSPLKTRRARAGCRSCRPSGTPADRGRQTWRGAGGEHAEKRSEPFLRPFHTALFFFSLGRLFLWVRPPTPHPAGLEGDYISSNPRRVCQARA